MRVLIDGTPLLLKSAGVKNYIYHWASALIRKAPEQIEVFPFLGGRVSLQHEKSVVSSFGTAARLSLVQLLNLTGNWSKGLLRSRYDLFHVSQIFLNPPSGIHLTATIYDMSCWIVPETHTAANIAATKLYAERTLSRADCTIAISEQSRRDAIEILKLDPSRVTVVYPGVTDEFFNPSPEAIRSVRERFKLEKPYILYVGTIEPRKNVARLIKAYADLPDQVRGNVDLVVAGFLGWNYETEAAMLKNTPGVRYLGYVPESDMVGLTAGAEVMAYPSIYEGFGFPVAQAMASGVPVVTSRNSSLSEICGDTAVLVDCYDVSDISAGIAGLLDRPSDARVMAQRARERAALFTWERSAMASMRLFQQVVSAA